MNDTERGIEGLQMPSLEEQEDTDMAKTDYITEDGKEVGVPWAIRDAVQTVGENENETMLTIYDYDKETKVLTLDGSDLDMMDPITVSGVENALEKRDDVKLVEWYIPRDV